MRPKPTSTEHYLARLDTTHPMTAIATHVQFMGIMRDYMELQETAEFDVQQHLMLLYQDLADLYEDKLE